MQEFILVYDGSFNGLLSCIFYVFENKLNTVTIQAHDKPQTKLFGDVRNILTEEKKAMRVWQGLQSSTSKRGSINFYYTFLSEMPNIEHTLLAYTRHIFNTTKNMGGDYGEEAVIEVTQIARMVAREKHRMEAFVRFKLTKDEIYFASIHPDVNVLPLISHHFKKRYADQQWIIYDLKRAYGIHYDLHNVHQIEINFSKDFVATEISSLLFAEEEIAFQTLWQNYFKSTNITERKNMKLHIRHIPKRYWKYLSEKMP